MTNEHSAKVPDGSSNGQTVNDLEWTGERLVPSISGQIASEHLHRYAIARTLAHGKDVLDIASGEGYGSALLSQQARSVTGVEIDQAAVDHAQRKYGSDKLRFLQGDCIAIPLTDASVDMVVSFETIEHIKSHEKFLSEIRRVLRPGGLLVISTPEKVNYNNSENPFHVHELSRDEFKTLVTDWFKNSTLLAQRYLAGSVIIDDEENPSATYGIFHGSYKGIDFSRKLVSPAYLLAICSNEPLPPLPAGIFEFMNPAGDQTGAEPALSYMQVFADRGTGYAESSSVGKFVPAGAWQTLRFERIEQLQPSGDRRLRIDPVNQPAILKIASIRIVRDGDKSVLYSADSQAGFEKMTFSSDLQPHFYNGEYLSLFSTGNDPQIYLPLFSGLGPGPCTLEINLQIQVTGIDWVLNQTAIAENGRMREEITELKNKNRRLANPVESVKQWVSSRFKSPARS
ncbi:MAG: class I SAM-dependent methyltransferase [Chthoniobacteraceae bacterium]